MNTVSRCAGRLLALIMCSSAALLHGADKVWNGAANANWNTDSIWTPAGAPLAGESVALSNKTTSGLSLTVPAGTAAVAASLLFDNPTNITLVIANGGSLAVGGMITNPLMSTAWFQVYNSAESNAASVFTASSVAGRELALQAGAGPQYLTTGYDIKYNTQLTVLAGGSTQTNYYRQTNGVITITSSDYGLTLVDCATAVNSDTAFYLLDGGTLKADRIGIGNGNGNNGGSPSVDKWPGRGFFDFNNGTVQTRLAGNNVWFENGSAFETYNGTSVKVKDIQRNTSKPVTIRLAQTGTHAFDALFSDSHIVISPSAQLVDKPGEAGILTKTGPGNLILTGGGLAATNTWSGDTISAAGKVQGNCNILAGAPGGLALKDAYSPRSKLVLNGGGFELVGRANATNSTFTNVTVPKGGGSFAEGYNMTVPSTAGLVVGQAVSNTNFLPGTYIRRIVSGTTIGLSHMSTSLVNVAAQTVDFGAAAFTSEQTVSNVELVASSSTVTVTPNGTSTLLTFVNVSGTGGVAKAGTGTLRLTGAITYSGKTSTTGLLDFASGANVLLTNAVTGGGIIRQSGAVTTAVIAATNYLNGYSGAVVVDSGTLQFGYGLADQYRGLNYASSYTVNSGAMIIAARDAMNGGATYNLNGGTLRISPAGGCQCLGPLYLNGGTIITARGCGDPWSAFFLSGNVTVTGAAPSVIRSEPALYNGVHLTFNMPADGSMRVFRVEDATGSADPDLTISANLLNSSHTSKLAGLIKTGAGTLLLSGSTNIYGGATIVSNGTLLVSGGGVTSSVTVVSGAAFGAEGTNVARVAGLTLDAGAKLLWSYDGSARTAGRIAVSGTLSLPAAATLDMSGSGYLYSGQTLFSAGAIAGATDLSGWTITGAPDHSRLVVVGTQVKLLVNRGTLIGLQ